MNHQPNLQILIHRTDGSVTTFIQTNLEDSRKILDEFQPTQFFYQQRVVFTDGSSITSLPVSSITRIDFLADDLSRLVLPVGTVDGVELTEGEFQALVGNPVMREQWNKLSSQDDFLVTFLNIEMADGQSLFLTTELRVTAEVEDLWQTNGFPIDGSGLCFRLRNGGVSVVNLANLTRLTFFPKPLVPPADAWNVQPLQDGRDVPSPLNGPEPPMASELPPHPVVRREKTRNFQRK